MVITSSERFPLFSLGSQQVSLDFQGGTIVSDAGLLAVRALERPLGIIAQLAKRLPDPRSPKYIQHSVEAIVTQEVYSRLAGYPDHNDADDLRLDPLFQILADVSPDADRPLASGSTLARFAYAFTRREADLSVQERDVLLEMRQAQIQRLHILNDYLIELFIRTRATPPTEVILDIDATDDPVHGGQALAAYHAYYKQQQYFPLLVFEGHSGFPLAACLRPGTLHASVGAVDLLGKLVTRLRAAWPEVSILVRADNGLGVPELYDYCEAEQLLYCIGYSNNPVLQRATETAFTDLQTYYAFYGQREPHVQRFEQVPDYQAESWPHPRRVIAKLEITPQGSQCRFVVTNLPDPAAVIYRDIYVQRGAVPEQPIGELKNGLQCDRLSASGFCANAFGFLVHVLAFAIVVLFREANAKVPEVATASVVTLRQRLWKVGAVLLTSARRIHLQLSSSWPYREVWCRVLSSVQEYVKRWQQGRLGGVGL